MLECYNKERCLNYPNLCPSCHATADMIWPYPLFKDKDVVMVVRCKDCRYCDKYYPAKEVGKEAMPAYKCLLDKQKRKADDFCSQGRKKDSLTREEAQKMLEKEKKENDKL